MEARDIVIGYDGRLPTVTVPVIVGGDQMVDLCDPGSVNSGLTTPIVPPLLQGFLVIDIFFNVSAFQADIP